MTPLPDDPRSPDDRLREACARGEWRERFVKMRATQGDVGEYVWLEVLDWRDGALDGKVITPAPRVGVAMAQSLSIDEPQAYDQMVRGSSGITVLPLTDIVATDYGQDI